MKGIGQLTRAQHAGLIREQNDAFRNCPSGGKVKLTFGVLEKFRGVLDELISAIISFDDFSEDNDPYGQHDFGCLSFQGEPVFWKIDYYDLDMTGGSPNPANPDVTMRMMTVMMAWEY